MQTKGSQWGQTRLVSMKATFWGTNVAVWRSGSGSDVCVSSSHGSLHFSTQNLIRWWSDVDLSSCCCLNKKGKMSTSNQERPRSLIQPNVGEKFLKRSESEECDRRHASLKWVHLAGIISLELQNIFLYSSASKSQRNNIFQHNLKWCWRKKRRTWRRSRGCQWLCCLARALMDYLIISPSRRSALLMVGNMAFTSLKE